MDIHGSDVGLYLPDTGSTSESSYKCTCGFSAIVNRRFAYHAGLFYEDEVEVTGLRDDRFEQRKPPLHILPDGKEEVEDVPLDVLNLLMTQFAVSFPTSCVTGQLSSLNMATSSSFSGSLLDELGLRGEGLFYVCCPGFCFHCLLLLSHLHDSVCLPCYYADIFGV